MKEIMSSFERVDGFKITIYSDYTYSYNTGFNDESTYVQWRVINEKVEIKHSPTYAWKEVNVESLEEETFVTYAINAHKEIQYNKNFNKQLNTLLGE